MTKKYRAVAGFTLVETSIAVVILALVMGGSYQTVYMTANLTKKSRLHFVAMHIANNRIERARNYAFYNLTLMADSNVYLNIQGAPVAESAADFRRTTIVTTNPAANLTKVLVRVDIKNYRVATNWWSNNEHESVSTYLTTYVPKPLSP